MYDERDYRAEWEKEYKDDYEAEEADWRLDDEREMHRD
jgi:hypothetical protein